MKALHYEMEIVETVFVPLKYIRQSSPGQWLIPRMDEPQLWQVGQSSKDRDLKFIRLKYCTESRIWRIIA